MIACFYNVFLRTAITTFPIKIVLQRSFNGFLAITFNNFSLHMDYPTFEWIHLNNIWELHIYSIRKLLARSQEMSTSLIRWAIGLYLTSTPSITMLNRLKGSCVVEVGLRIAQPPLLKVWEFLGSSAPFIKHSLSLTSSSLCTCDRRRGES